MAISPAPDPTAPPPSPTASPLPEPAPPVAKEPIEPASAPETAKPSAAEPESKPEPKPVKRTPAATKSAPPELEAEDLAVLEVLAQEGRLPEARTAWAVAISLERRPDQVNSILTRLARRGAVEGSVVRVGGEVWAVTAAGTEHLGSSE